MNQTASTSSTGASSAVSVRPVAGKRDLRTFIEVPFSLYQDDPNWVPPLIVERLDHLNMAKNPFFEHGEAELFLAFRDGQCVGRISASICRLHLERHKDNTGFFGFLEAIDDRSVFEALFSAAEGWLKSKGMGQSRGPFSFSINDESGLLIEGFDTPPSLFMGHAPKYYRGHVEALGYAKAKDLIAYDYDGSNGLTRIPGMILKRANRNNEITVRPLNMKELDSELALIIDIFNDAWCDNWGFVPLTPAEIDEFARNLKNLVREEYIAIAYYRGEPAAMAVTLPNINAAIADLNGRLLPFGWLKLLWRLKIRPPASTRLPLMGVRKHLQNKAVGSGLSIQVFESVRKYHVGRGTPHSEFSWVLEDNMGIRKMIESLGAVAYKTYRVYERPLG